MSIAGKWTFHYSWGCTGTYAQDEVDLNSNGTFVDGFGDQGKWVESPGMMELQYDKSKTNYAGNVQGSAMVGISATFSGLQGCWYAIRGDAKTFTRAEQAPELDLAGNEQS